jgi:hypothetical protein
MSRRPETHHHPDASYQQAYDALYGRVTGRKGRFRRDWLPDMSPSLRLGPLKSGESAW